MPFEFQGKASQLCLVLPIVSPFILYTLNLRCSGGMRHSPHYTFVATEASVESSSRSCLGTINKGNVSMYPMLWACLCIQFRREASSGQEVFLGGSWCFPGSKQYLPHSNGWACKDTLPAPFPVGWSRSW